jgi:endonuclease-3
MVRNGTMKELNQCKTSRPSKPRPSGPAKPKTAAERKQRVAAILKALDQRYAGVTCALHHRNAWELLVATILSAQCTDERVNKVTPGLFAKYPTMQDFAAVNVQELAADIYSTGFFNNKAKSIVGAAKTILSEFGGEIPRDIDQLLTVPGAARKTANIAQRLDLTKEQAPVKIEQDLMRQVPREHWIQFSHQVIHFGRELCAARKTRCGECPVESLCYAKDKLLV